MNNDGLDDILAGNAEEVAAEATKASCLNGNFSGAWTFFKFNEEKSNFSFGFNVVTPRRPNGELLFTSCKIPAVANQDVALNYKSYWDAMKKESGIGNLVKFITILYVLGIVDKDGNATSFRKSKGATVYVRASVGETGQNIEVSRPKNGATAPFDVENIRMVGLDQAEEVFSDIKDEVLKHVIQLYENEQLVVVDAGVKRGAVVMTSKYDKDKGVWRGVFSTPEGKFSVRLEKRHVADVATIQQLYKVLGRNEAEHRGQFVDILVGADEMRNGTGFNTLEKVLGLSAKAEGTPSAAKAPETSAPEAETPDFD
jgi:hypothetical protein